MKYLTLDEVYAIHTRMISVGGGRSDIHDFALLHSAVERPKATFGGRDLYPTVWKKAGALMQSLVKNHPFDDGNKRTAYYSTKRFLHLNGQKLFASKDLVVPFMVAVDVKNLSVDNIVEWLRLHSKKMK